MIEHLTEFQYKDDDENLYPLYLYIYNAEGNHQGGIKIENKIKLEYAFRSSIKMAINQKREVRITDTEDLLCFHSKDGKILYDGVKRYDR